MPPLGSIHKSVIPFAWGKMKERVPAMVVYGFSCLKNFFCLSHLLFCMEIKYIFVACQMSVLAHGFLYLFWISLTVPIPQFACTFTTAITAACNFLYRIFALLL